ncbi:MAG TPA: L-histidine N(alpha)-methyltransferase [Xanthobacteraceae bacterium]|nr:L-histidine N(alpha)-methyltransferase [Xanthobacteraceae bacterium]
MNVQIRKARLAPLDAATRQFAADAIAGLTAPRKQLSPKYFYDAAGSQLFEEICLLPEYYPTRTELGILRANTKRFAALMPKDAALIEFGAGSATKAKLLLSAAPHVTAYVPVDISAEFLVDEAKKLGRDIPRISVHPVAADFTQPFTVPKAVRGHPRVGFFPGSTIGNFERPQAIEFLRQAASVLGPDAVFIVGADRVKDEGVLHAAYNDAAGVTAAFNLNLLVRMNHELGADFDLAAFAHTAPYNRELSRIEMHLESTREQTVNLLGHTIRFRKGETIHTECSHKFTVENFTGMAAEANWSVADILSDPRDYFSVYVLRQNA